MLFNFLIDLDKLLQLTIFESDQILPVQILGDHGLGNFGPSGVLELGQILQASSSFAPENPATSPASTSSLESHNHLIFDFSLSLSSFLSLLLMN